MNLVSLNKVQGIRMPTELSPLSSLPRHANEMTLRLDRFTCTASAPGGDSVSRVNTEYLISARNSSDIYLKKEKGKRIENKIDKYAR
ncbi:hypothetical protein TNCV_2341391 [Trichonephila clavipes]|nr:hypothetical protein TNCV_2341391 [Trichonephila clavipes]